MAPPDKLRIKNDRDEGGRFDYVGKFPDGKQFMAFVTGAFPGEDRYPDSATARRVKQWLAVLHKFDSEGNYISSETRRGGFDSEGDIAGEKAWVEFDRMLAQEEVEFCDINVKLFNAEIEGIFYSLEYDNEVDEDEADEDDDCEYEAVMLWPNDIMFHPPWDSGSYST